MSGGAGAKAYYGTWEMLGKHLRSTAAYVASSPMSYWQAESLRDAANELAAVLADVLEHQEVRTGPQTSDY